MPLTPTDVHHTTFGKPALGRRGYDIDEVSAFLDEVEEALTRLVEENSQLKEHVAKMHAGGTVGAHRLTAESSELQARVEELRAEKAAAEARVDRLRDQLRQVRSPGTTGGEHGALEVLVQAQRTVDNHLLDAQREANHLLASARATAERATSEAQTNARALEREVRARYQESLGPLEAKLAELQSHIEQLKNFERETQSRLRAYLQGRIQNLGSRDDDAAWVDQRPSERLPAPRSAPKAANA